MSKLRQYCFLGWALFFVGCVFIKGRPWIRFFQWHPVLSAIAFGLLIPEAVTQVNRLSEFGQRSSYLGRVTMHMLVQSFSLILALIGLVIAVVHRENTNQKHFISYHSYFGLLTIFYAVLQSVSGLLTTYPNLKPAFAPSTFRLKNYHTLSGGIFMLLAALTLLLGTFNMWLRRYIMRDPWSLLAVGLSTYPIVLAVRAIWLIKETGGLKQLSQNEPVLPVDRIPAPSLSTWKRRRVSNSVFGY